MPDETATDSSAAVADAQTDAPSTATAPADAPTPEQSQDDRARAWFADNPEEATATTDKPAKDAEPNKDEPADTKATDKPAQEQQVDPNDPRLRMAELSPEDQQLVRRHGYEAEDIPADPARRASWLRRLDKIQRDRDAWFNNNRNKPPQPDQPAESTPATTPAPGSPDIDRAFEPLRQVFDDFGAPDAIKQLRTAIDAQVQAKLQEVLGTKIGDVSNDVDRWTRSMIKRDFDSALKAWNAPEGVDVSKPDAQAKVREIADRLFNAEIAEGKHPTEIDVKRLAHSAAFLAFQSEQATAAQREAENRARNARSRSPESAVRQPQTQPVKTLEDRQNEWLAKHPERAA